MNMHCFLCFYLMHDALSLCLRPINSSSSPVHGARSPFISLSITTSPTSLFSPHTITDTAVCVAAWPVPPLPVMPRLAWHWPPTPQDHSGTLGAEEFKACLISLGFDIGNDAQVLSSRLTSAVRSLTGLFLSSLSILPVFLSLLRIPLVKMPFVVFYVLQHPLWGLLWLLFLNSTSWFILFPSNHFPPLSLFLYIPLATSLSM